MSHLFQADVKPLLLEGNYLDVKGFFDSALPQYFHFEFNYVPEEDRFREIDRFLWESRHLMTRFRNRYYGPTVIGLTAWNHKYVCENTYFEAFMYFLKDYSDENELHFYIEETISNELYHRLSTFFDVRLQSQSQTVKKDAKHPIGFSVEREE